MNPRQEEFTAPANDIGILLKIGHYFIPKKEISSVTRFGKGTKITLVSGEEVLVKVSYDKVVELVK